MIADAGFLFSVAALNASFAGLGGLLVGLRRGPELGALEVLRLRQVVEFAFANVIFAISLQPSVALLGPDAAFRISGGLAFTYLVGALAILRRRVARVGIAWGRWWAAAALSLTAGGAGLALAVIAQPSVALYELMLVAMLARPMATFLLVLGTIETPEPAGR